MRLGRPGGRKGVSEVVGALLLIIVVVTAVASLSYFLASAQKQAENRSTYLTNVHNDNLQTVFALFAPSDPTIQWELDGCTFSAFPLYTGNWYVQQVASNPAVVNLKPKGPGAATVQGVNLASGIYNAISKGAHATPSYSPPASYMLTFGSGGVCTFNPAAWNTITMAVRNTNTAASALEGVEVNGVWGTTWYQVDQTGNVLTKLGIAPLLPLPIPAKGSVNIMLNGSTFPSSPPLKNESLTIALLSTAGNYFTTSFDAPTAVPRSGGATQNYQIVSRDIVTFDGSLSYATNSSIQSYEWRLDVPTPATSCPTSFTTSTTFDTVYVGGQTLQYTPESLFSTAQLASDCITGPIRVTLLVADANGFLATSQSVIVAPDPNIAPPGSLSSPTCTVTPSEVTVLVQDIYGRPVVGTIVTAVRSSGDVTTPSTAITDPTGKATFAASWTVHPSSVQLQTGTLPPVEAVCP
jgi:flagellin-like protein